MPHISVWGLTGQDQSSFTELVVAMPHISVRGAQWARSVYIHRICCGYAPHQCQGGSLSKISLHSQNFLWLHPKSVSGGLTEQGQSTFTEFVVATPHISVRGAHWARPIYIHRICCGYAPHQCQGAHWARSTYIHRTCCGYAPCQCQGGSLSKISLHSQNLLWLRPTSVSGGLTEQGQSTFTELVAMLHVSVRGAHWARSIYIHRTCCGYAPHQCQGGSLSEVSVYIRRTCCGYTPLQCQVGSLSKVSLHSWTGQVVVQERHQSAWTTHPHLLSRSHSHLEPANGACLQFLVLFQLQTKD
jgi:hypothetical protein